ncbi:MAG: chloride channel protein [Caldilineaceae bacterium]
MKSTDPQPLFHTIRQHLPTFILESLNIHSVAALMAIAIFVGFGTGLAAVIFIKAIGLVNTVAFEQGLPQLLKGLGSSWIILVPIIGSLISGPIIAWWAIEAKGHGVPEVMQAIIMEGGRIRPRVALVKSLASAVCLGTGGSAGREGPVVQVGAALGSTAAQLLGLTRERTITLVACGAAAGIAATFNAPIAGVIFAMEVILGEFTTHYFGAVVIAAVAASVVSRHFIGVNPAFTVPTYTLVSAWELLFYALLGVASALVGWTFVSVLYFLEERFDNWRFPTALKPAVGAIAVGLTGFVAPLALGTGLPTIERSLNEALPWTLLLLLLVAKLVATSFTLGSGNSGGIFSPSLYMGAMLGSFFGHWIHLLAPSITADAGAYALVGMASVFAAAAHAPLTASLIVFEMSNDYRMILPLLVTVGLSTLLSQYMRRYSIYTLKLVEKGIPLERERDIDLMRSIQVGEIMNEHPDVVTGQLSLQKLAEMFMQTRHHGFPVVDQAGKLLGVVTVQDLERAVGEGAMQERTVADIATRAIVTVCQDDTLSVALHIMSEHDFGRIPVVERQDPSHLVGLLRRADIIRAYRHAILRKMEEQHRTENLRLGHLTDTEILEIQLTDGMRAVGRRIKELQLPSQILITSIRRNGKVVLAHGDTLFQVGDQVVIMAQQDTVTAVHRALCGDNVAVTEP